MSAIFNLYRYEVVAIDLRSLRYFTAMATSGSISKAAAELHIAQPALSQHLKMLESELSVKLLERTAKGVTPTPAGLKFLAHSRDILERLQIACEDVREGASEPTGTISIGMPQSIGLALTPRLVPEVVQRWPKLRLQIIEMATGHMPGHLASREIDLGITFLQDKASGLRYQSLVEEELILVGPPGFYRPFSREALSKAQKVEFARVSELQLILSSPRHSLRELIERYAQKTKVKLKVIADVDSIPQLTSLVAGGLGHTILSFPSVVSELEQGKLSAARLINPKVLRTVFLCRLAGLATTSNVAAIESLITETVDTLVKQGSWPGRKA